MWQQIAMKTSLHQQTVLVVRVMVFNGKSLTVLSVEDSRTHPHYSAKLLWEDDMFMTERKPIHYYRMSFPTQMLPDIIMWSAKAMPSNILMENGVGVRLTLMTSVAQRLCIHYTRRPKVV